MNATRQQNIRRVRNLLVAFAAICMCFCAEFAHADGISFSIQSTAANAGSSGDRFEVILTNSGPSTVNIAGFSFGLQTSDADIIFTDVTTDTTTSYIFAGDSLFGPDIVNPGGASGQQILASDLELTGSGIDLLAGQSLGLGEVFFNVSPTASTGIANLTFLSFPSSSLADSSAADIAIAELNGGTVTISGSSSVPEPSSVLLLAAGIGILGYWHRNAARNISY